MDHRSILERAPLPIMIIQDGVIRYVNPSFGRILGRYGYPFDERTVVGQLLADFVHPSERQASRDNIQRLLAAEDPVAWNIPRLLQDAQGRPYPALISTSRTTWQGRPALEASFVLLETDHRVGEDGVATPPEDHIDARHQALENLTSRERQVALLIASGYNTANIRTRLGIRDSTLRSHIKSIYRKTATHSRTELTRYLIGFR